MYRTLENALDYLRRGLSIIPLQPHGKEPNTFLLPDRIDPSGNVLINPKTGKPRKTWEAFVTRHPTEADVQRWFTRVPNANLAVLTGATSGVIVLDIDGPEGMKFVNRRGGIPCTPTTATGRGLHVWLKHPGFTVRNFVHALPDLDMRGDGGYVCVYPSIHPSGAQYRWKVGLDVPFAPVPDWLMEIIKPTPGPNESQRREVPVTHLASTSAWARAALTYECMAVRNAAQGQQNNVLNRAAFKMGQIIARDAIDRATVENALAAAAANLSDRDGELATLRTIQSGLNAGLLKQRR